MLDSTNDLAARRGFFVAADDKRAVRISTTHFRRLRHEARIYALFLLVVLAFLSLSGCAARRMKTDFKDFESAYAETSNREVLLNLARLENHDPTYFFKLGQISTSYRMQASLNASGNYVTQGMTPGGSNVTAGVTPSILYENDPAFTFIPVNDDTNAQLLLKPVPAETLYVLYQQGWRLDQLFRLMVDRIELTSNDDQRCITETIRNTPEDLGGYVRFLRISAILYVLQKRGYLLLRGEGQFIAHDKDSVLPGSAKPQDSTPPKGLEKPAEPIITAKDFNDAWGKDSVWERVKEDGEDKWRLGRESFNPSFLLNPPFIRCSDPGAGQRIAKDDKLCPDLNKIEKDVSEKLDYAPELLTLTLEGLIKGFSIEGTGNPSAKLFCQTTDLSSSPPGRQQIQQIHLVMRSLIGLMAAAAQEQDLLEKKKSTPVPLDFDPLLKAHRDSKRTFAELVPQLERLPLLQLKWNAEDGEPTLPLIAPLNYRGNTYVVADRNVPSFDENQYWNRDMFRLISELSAQVTVDISKFPLPEILQLRTQ